MTLHAVISTSPQRSPLLPAARFVVDGELVVLDADGRSNFAKLARGRTGTHYYAFDLLMLGGDLRAKPLEARKAGLAKLLQGCGEPLRYCDHVVGRGKDFFDAVRKAGLEGMVAKRRRSQYAGELNDDWLKVKCLRVHDFVVGGWIPDGSQVRACCSENMLTALCDTLVRLAPHPTLESCEWFHGR
jgi:bifunctional non-homologous end joining protein LigD